MKQFNINSIVEQYKLNTEDLAKVLFPAIKYPGLAFARIQKGEAALDTEQLRRLADFIGVPISELFTENGWNGAVKEGVLTFIKGPYEVRLNYAGTFATLYKDGVAFDKILINTTVITLEEFITILNKYINNFEHGTN